MKFFYKCIASLMAILVFFSASAFAVNMHFCGKTLVDYSLTTHVERCAMDAKKPVPQPSCDNFQKQKCCSDKHIVKNQDDVKPSPQLAIHQQAFMASFTISYWALFQEQITQPAPFIHYSPPLLVSNIQLLDETFLI